MCLGPTEVDDGSTRRPLETPDSARTAPQEPGSVALKPKVSTRQRIHHWGGKRDRAAQSILLGRELFDITHRIVRGHALQPSAARQPCRQGDPWQRSLRRTPTPSSQRLSSLLPTAVAEDADTHAENESPEPHRHSP